MAQQMSENFEHLNSYPIDEWNGGKVHFIENDIIHLMRGQIFSINGIKLFTFGGAYSIDRSYGSKGITWFPEEVPTIAEYEEIDSTFFCLYDEIIELNF